MKAKFTLFSLLFLALVSVKAQQVPNPSFDVWTSSLNPDGWSTYESVFGMALGLSSKDDVDFAAPPYSLKLTSDSVPGQPAYGVIAGAAVLGAGGVGVQGLAGKGIPFTHRPDTVFIVYKYTSPGTDTPAVTMKLKSAGSSVLGSPTFGASFLFPPTSQWAAGYLPITAFYNGAAVPDTLQLTLFSSKPSQTVVPVKGSTFNVDGILFGYVQLPNDLQKLADQLEFSVFPNPAADFVTISAKQNVDGFRAVISDINGKIVSVNYLNGTTSRLAVTDYANGTYIYRIADKEGNELKQGRFTVAN